MFGKKCFLVLLRMHILHPWLSLDFSCITCTRVGALNNRDSYLVIY